MDDQHEPPDVVDVIRSIATGSSVDWTGVDTAPADRSMHEMLHELRVIARIAEVHGATASATVDVPVTPVEDGPRTWGPLTLLERVGEGSYGLVYRAWDSRLDREVALKLLRRIDRDANGAADSGGRTVEEGKLLARVRHPNVVTVHGADRVDRRIGIWMEFVDGRTLEAIVRDDGPLPPIEVMRIGVEVAHGLSAVHAAGLIHRDVKAQNVMRQPDGRIVLMDFGAGLLTDVAALPSLVGTPLYAAPELLAGQPATPRSDVYSVGVLLFHLLTGQYPVMGTTLSEVRQAHEQGRIASLKAIRPDTPSRLARVVERALAPDPDRRFASAEHVTAVLTAAQAAPRRLMIASAAAIALVATTLVGWGVDRAMTSRRNRPSLRAAAMSAHQIDWRFAWLFLGAPSPDGRWLSYTEAKTGNVALLDLKSGATTLVTGDASFAANRYVTSSRFSADSERIAYSWYQGDHDGAEIRIAEVRDKSPRLLLRDESAEDAAVLAWSHDGAQLVVRLEPRDGVAHLELVTVATGARRSVGASIPNATPGGAAFSPDDRFIVYDMAASAESPRHLHILDVTGGADRLLLTGATEDADPLWAGGQVFFSSTRGGKRGLWRVPVVEGNASGRPTLVSDQLASGFWSVGLTDSGSFYYAAAEGLSSVYTASANTGPEIGTPVRVSAADTPALSPEWSPDGREIVWVSRSLTMGPRAATLRFRDVTTDQERVVAPPFAVGVNPRWSPDGTRLLVRGTDEKGGGLRMIDVRTGRLLDSFLLGRPGDAAWSMDGTQFFYIDVKSRMIGRLDVASRTEHLIYRLPAPYEFERGLALTPAGDRLAFAVAHAGLISILTISTRGGSAETLLTLRPPHRLGLQQWTRDGTRVLFVRSRAIPGAPISQEWQLWSVDRTGGEPRYLDFSMPNLYDVRPSPDGGQLVFSSSNAENRLRVVENVLSATTQNREP